MSGWTPTDHHKDPMVNAVLNLAEELNQCAQGLGAIASRLSISPGSNGLSVAEALDLSATHISSAISTGLREIAEAAESRD